MSDNPVQDFIDKQKMLILELSLGLDEEDDSEENAALKLTVEKEKRNLKLAESIQQEMTNMRFEYLEHLQDFHNVRITTPGNIGEAEQGKQS